MSDRSDYTDTGNRGTDARTGFGDDMGTRVGRPDGAAKPAPRDASPVQQPGQAGTNDDAVADGIEGSIMDEGPEQQRIQRASDQGDLNPAPAAGDERRIDDL
jgi:hypothetical protein